ncbi:hypothetical protein KKF61_09180, partial [Patescibacteria group bacterium]|nr:hypothetical protein [Patescibacteria group bacterium]
DYTDYLIEIEAQGISSNIISTQDHPFLVIKSDRCPYHKRNRYCIPGLHPNNNKPCKYCKTKQYSEPEWTAAQSITPGDFVLEPIIQSVPRCSIPDIIQKPARGRIKLSNYSIEDDFITGVAIGFYLSEGHATKYNVVFGSGKNEEHQRIALDDFCSRHSVHTHHKPVYREDGTGCIVSQANSVELCAWLRSQFGHLSNSKYIPDWVYSSSDELKLGIVSGYIEGDGCCFNGSLSATSTSLSLLTSIKAILAQFEIISSSGREDKKEQYTITISAQGGYKLRQLTNSYGRKISRTTDTNHQSGSVVHKGYILRRVKSVNKKDTKCKVYNLQVANTQTYNAYGIAVHNSDNFINFRMGNPYCVSPETLIETGKLDFKKAKDVIIQDELVTHKGNLISPIAIFDRLRTEDEKAYRVNIASLSGVDIVVSKEHPFLVCSNVGYQSRQPLRLIKRYEYANTILRVLKDFPNVKKKQISELTGLHPANVRVILDFMAKDRKITKDLFGNIRIMDKDEYDLYMIKNRFEWKNADKLVPGDYVVYPRPLANPEVLKDYNCPLLRILTLDRLSGFAMGLFLAEGSTDKNQIYLSLHQKEEETLLPIFNDWLVSIRQNPLKVYKDGRLYNGRSRKGIKCCRHNPSLAKVLRDVFGNNSHNKSIPDWVMDAPDEFVLGLIHGYLEGDGYDRVRHDGYGTTLILSFSSCNQQLLLHVGR